METLIKDSALLDLSPIYEAYNLDCATNILINLTQRLILSNPLKYRLPTN